MRDVLRFVQPLDESGNGARIVDAAKRHQGAVAQRRGGLRVVEDSKARIARAELTHHLHRGVCDHSVVVAEQGGDGGGVLCEIGGVHFWRGGVFVVGPYAGESVETGEGDQRLFARAGVHRLEHGHDERKAGGIGLLASGAQGPGRDGSVTHERIQILG